MSRALSLFLVLLHAASAYTQCCTAGKNLVVNGDFSIPRLKGEIPKGFRSSNIFSDTGSNPGLYSLIQLRGYGACMSNPQFDHTYNNETGMYLWHDATFNTDTAWIPFDETKQGRQRFALPVSPGKTYVFSFWVRDIGRNFDCILGGAPIVSMVINGQEIKRKDLQRGSSLSCCPAWENLCTQWHSGNETEVYIMIMSNNGDGNTDLGIDDVYFGEKIDSITFSKSSGSYCNEGITLSSNLNAGTFTWNTGDTTESINVSHSGKYWVKLKPMPGCRNLVTDTASVTLIPDNIRVPNIFTPNGDGINDFFYADKECQSKYYLLEIFDRWGLRCFQSDKQEDRWDGKRNGENASEGTYYYVLTLDGKTYPGIVTLVR